MLALETRVEENKIESLVHSGLEGQMTRAETLSIGAMSTAFRGRTPFSATGIEALGAVLEKAIGTKLMVSW